MKFSLFILSSSSPCAIGCSKTAGCSTQNNKIEQTTVKCTTVTQSAPGPSTDKEGSKDEDEPPWLKYSKSLHSCFCTMLPKQECRVLASTTGLLGVRYEAHRIMPIRRSHQGEPCREQRRAQAHDFYRVELRVAGEDPIDLKMIKSNMQGGNLPREETTG